MPVITLPIVNLRCIVPMLIGVGALQRERMLKGSDIVPNPIEVLALVDTGAKRSVIDPKMAEMLGLKGMGHWRLSTSTSKGHEVPAYDVAAAIIDRKEARFWFNRDREPRVHWLSQDLRVVAAPIRHAGFEVLLGMDLLAGRLLMVNGKSDMFQLRI